jgi:hypothetical protein
MLQFTQATCETHHAASIARLVTMVVLRAFD